MTRIQRIFVYELVTGGGLFGSRIKEKPTGALYHEGAAMLSGVCSDLAMLPGIELVTLRDSRIPSLELPATLELRVTSAASEQEAFRSAARTTDATLVIAPEFGGLLADRTEWAEKYSQRLLCPDTTFVRLAGDKWDCFNRLSEHQVPTIDTCRAVDESSWQSWSERPAITKPADGACSDGLFIWARAADIPPSIRQDPQMLVQPRADGLAASCCAIGTGTGYQLLPPGRQILDDQFKYEGGRWPLCNLLAERARSLASLALDAMPPFVGWVGVDMILGQDSDTDFVVEINPRMTTSYTGLRRFLAANLAHAIVEGATTGSCPELGGTLPEFEFKMDSIR